MAPLMVYHLLRLLVVHDASYESSYRSWCRLPLALPLRLQRRPFRRALQRCLCRSRRLSTWARLHFGPYRWCVGSVLSLGRILMMSPIFIVFDLIVSLLVPLMLMISAPPRATPQFFQG